MKRNLPAMSALTTEEIGIDDETPEGASSSADSRSKSVKERSSSQKKQRLMLIMYKINVFVV
jgi:hypothetical protein